MKITHTDIYRFSIPMQPFTIATGTMDYAQNIFIRIFTDTDIYGVGECSAFPMIVGETQTSCFEQAKVFAGLWKGKDPLQIEERMAELDLAIAFNSTIKSAFDIALYDLAAKSNDLPLYKYLGGSKSKKLETDITVGIDKPEAMAQQAAKFQKDGFRIIKVKLGKDPKEDVERIKQIRDAIGPALTLRIDANQGWDYEGALYALQNLAEFDIQFCEQPMRYWNDPMLPQLKMNVPIRLMADESVYDHHDALRIIQADACDYVNIKFAKSGGILEATKINEVCAQHNIPCMMGGMLESRVALSSFAHFALAHDNIVFNDMDTCMLGHLKDPVKGGVTYNGYYVEVPDTPGIGADADEDFLKDLEKASI